MDIHNLSVVKDIKVRQLLRMVKKGGGVLSSYSIYDKEHKINEIKIFRPNFLSFISSLVVSYYIVSHMTKNSCDERTASRNAH